MLSGPGARAVVLLVGLALVDRAPRAADDPESLEYGVKAAYLYKFGAFVDWPAATFPTSASPIVLCLISGDAFGEVVESIAQGQRIRDRPIEVRRLRHADANSGCHTLYIDVASSSNLDATLDSMRSSAVLTVLSDSPRGNGPRGIINFLVKDNRLRFTIDADAARRSGLVISSRLLALALQPGTEG